MYFANFARMDKKRLQIAYLTATDARDKRSWSGIHYYIARSLELHCGDIHHLGPIEPKTQLFIGKIFSGVSQKVFSKRYDYSHSSSLAKAYAGIAEKKLAKEDYDLIFAPTGSTLIAHLDTDLPIVTLSDTTFANMIGYYAGYTGLWQRSEDQGVEIEKLALKRADLILYPSKWAADSAIQLGADPAKVHVVPLGANIDKVPAREEVLNKPADGTCQLLFLGVDWERKGGAIAFEAFKELKKQGVNAKLTVCGCVPPGEFTDPDMHVIPFIDKNDPRQSKIFYDLLLSSHFLLLPTRAECYGIVFCEASAFGLISVATQTGGVGGAVKENVNGFLLSPDKDGKAYAETIREIWNQPDRYNALVQSSRMLYELELNWDSWGKRVSELIGQMLAAKQDK
jgi:glycosyltransferase involved in cell wall biosynthesis